MLLLASAVLSESAQKKQEIDKYRIVNNAWINQLLQETVIPHLEKPLEDDFEKLHHCKLDKEDPAHKHWFNTQILFTVKAKVELIFKLWFYEGNKALGNKGKFECPLHRIMADLWMSFFKKGEPVVHVRDWPDVINKWLTGEYWTNMLETIFGDYFKPIPKDKKKRHPSMLYTTTVKGEISVRPPACIAKIIYQFIKADSEVENAPDNKQDGNAEIKWISMFKMYGSPQDVLDKINTLLTAKQSESEDGEAYKCPICCNPWSILVNNGQIEVNYNYIKELDVTPQVVAQDKSLPKSTVSALSTLIGLEDSPKDIVANLCAECKPSSSIGSIQKPLISPMVKKPTSKSDKIPPSIRSSSLSPPSIPSLSLQNPATLPKSFSVSPKSTMQSTFKINGYTPSKYIIKSKKKKKKKKNKKGKKKTKNTKGKKKDDGESTTTYLIVKVGDLYFCNECGFSDPSRDVIIKHQWTDVNTKKIRACNIDRLIRKLYNVCTICGLGFTTVRSKERHKEKGFCAKDPDKSQKKKQNEDKEKLNKGKGNRTKAKYDVTLCSDSEEESSEEESYDESTESEE